jgi:two-component system, NtrC family, sensor histidine kinase HydH
VRNNLGEEIRARGIEWLDSAASGMAPVIQGDTDLLYQAFLNVAMNAFEAMPDGGTFSVDLSCEGSSVRVDFSDTGHGIKNEDLARIFTPFFTTHQMGTGLGLSVVHNIIVAHGGEISVKSNEMKGTTFSILLPMGTPSESDGDSFSHFESARP